MNRNATREQVRLLLLLDAVEAAGLVPLDVRALHTLAYFANVLSPVWELPPMDGKVLKRRSGPFYPALQHDLDLLVGMGLVVITAIGHDQDEDGRWRLRGAFRLNIAMAARSLEAIRSFRDEDQVSRFLSELAMASSALPDAKLAEASSEDATFADPLSQPGNVVDFAEWQQRNYSANAARRFRSLVPPDVAATEGELLHLYLQHLSARLTS